MSIRDAAAMTRAGSGPPTRRLLRARRQLRADITQVLSAVAGLALGLTLPLLSGGPTVQSSRLAELLITLGIGVIGVVSIVYSLLFGVVQWSSTSFTPRLSLFRGDPLVWRTFAFAVGIFVFCVTAALVSGSMERVSVLVPGVAILAVLMAVALIRKLQTHAYLSLQLAYVVGAVAAEGRAVIEDVYPVRSAPDACVPGTAAPLPSLRRTVTWAGPSGLIQQLELRRLVAAATAADAVVAFRVGVGDILYEGSALADVYGNELPDPVVRAAVVRGPERSFDQDPMFALRLLADIGLRALSPGVNDPATAVESIDATEGLLRALAARDLAVTGLAGRAGRIRVRLVLPAWEDYLRTGVEDLLPAAAPSAMVLERLRRLLENLLEMSPPPSHPPLVRLREEVEARLAACRRGPVPLRRSPVADDARNGVRPAP
jgi:uncharacterized membrane protein